MQRNSSAGGWKPRINLPNSGKVVTSSEGPDFHGTWDKDICVDGPKILTL